MHAYVFPGQGAQSIGMGQELADAYPAAAAVFEEVDEALAQPLSALIWTGDQQTLTLTENAQPALMATSIAALRAMESENIAPNPAFVAGHSLGEYSALCAAGALSLTDTARLLRLRGTAMQEAVPVGIGAMAAILGLDFATVQTIAEQAEHENSRGEICTAANDNDPSQVVVSGHKSAVERAVDLAKQAGAKRALILPVSAPFHCPLMQPAAEKMAEALADITITAPNMPLVCNVTATAITAPDEIKTRLIEQITGSVRWRDSIGWMTKQGVTDYYEIGAGKALSGMIRRVNKDATCTAIGSPQDITNHKEG